MSVTGTSLQNRALLGMLLMIFGLALYPLSDALIKHLMGSYPVTQTTFLRGMTRLIPLCIALFYQGGPQNILKSSYPGRHLVRLAVNLAYTYAFMYAFSIGTLTTVYTLSYTSSFFLILLSSWILGETVSKGRWIAVAVGMCGVMIALRPSWELFEWSALLILLGTFLGALNKVLMRRLAETEHSLAITIYPNLAMMLVTFPLLLGTWEAMPWKDWGLFGLVGILAAGGQYAIAQSLRFAEASSLAPLDYSTFFWVVALDYFWWQATPDLYTVVGAAIIVASNLYILYRSRK
ncbi:MAG: DMT family transporter [Verrucomicrobia bacterium]|nr:DMT family transporter [Verrucomicrobiota bacterium]